MKFTGLDELQKYVGNLEKTHQETLLEVAGETLISLTRERFSLGKDPYGVEWKQSRRAARQSGQTLRDTGVLMNSFNWQPNNSTELIYGTNVEYAATHQFGRTIKMSKKQKARFGVDEVKIPKRPMLPDERGDPPAYDIELKESLEAALNATLAGA